jgi:hypothetical protein
VAREQIWSTQPGSHRGALMAGAILMGAGALLSMAGAIVGLAAVVSGLRHHIRTSDMPPSELAMQHWRRAKSAAHAGADSWRTVAGAANGTVG